MKVVLVFLSAFILLAPAPPAGALGPLDASAELGLFSKYVWRGITVTDDPVLQPVVAASVAGFGASVWGNMDLTDANATLEDPNGWKGRLNEMQYSLGYGISLPLLSLGAGLIHYTFPDSDVSSTTELYASGSAGILFSPTLAVHYDFGEIDAAYLAASVSHGLPLSPVADLKLGATLGYGTEDYVAGYFGPVTATKEFAPLGAGPTDLTLTAFLPYGPVPLVTVTPSVTYSTLLGDAGDVTDAADGDKTAFFFGLTARVAF